MVDFLYWILGKKKESQEALGKKMIKSEAQTYHALELEHVSPRCGAGRDLPKTLAGQTPLQSRGRKMPCI